MGLLFEIITNKGQKNYLLGTLHWHSEVLSKFPLEIVLAIKESKRFIFENNPTDELTDTYYKTARDWFLQAIPELLADQTEIMISVCNSQRTPISLYLNQILEQMLHLSLQSMEKQLIDGLKSKELPVLHLEAKDEQHILAEGYRFSFSQQKEFYQYMIQQPMIDFPRLEQLYLDENIEQITREANLHWLTTDDKIPGCVIDYHADLLQNRDPILAARIEPFFEEGSSFAAVGVGHILGILNIFWQKGYAINPVQLSARKIPITTIFRDSERGSNPYVFWTESTQEQEQPIDHVLKISS